MQRQDLQLKFDMLLNEMKSILALRPKHQAPSEMVARIEFRASQAIKKAELK